MTARGSSREERRPRLLGWALRVFLGSKAIHNTDLWGYAASLRPTIPSSRTVSRAPAIRKSLAFIQQFEQAFAHVEIPARFANVIALDSRH